MNSGRLRTNKYPLRPRGGYSRHRNPLCYGTARQRKCIRKSYWTNWCSAKTVLLWLHFFRCTPTLCVFFPTAHYCRLVLVTQLLSYLTGN